VKSLEEYIKLFQAMAVWQGDIAGDDRVSKEIAVISAARKRQINMMIKCMQDDAEYLEWYNLLVGDKERPQVKP
jgi:hypothetical protein